MSSDEPLFLSREELLGELPAKRASTLLFAIESRTAYLVARSKRAMARFIAEKITEEQERAFLNALAEGRDLPIQPTIQDLEHHAAHWASLVPADAGLRATLAHAIGEKYLFTHAAVPSLRHALGLDDEAVAQAYLRSYGQPLSTIYAVQITRLERLRWRWAGAAKLLENLPPFWTAYALTLTETVSASILALPIALAGVGPIAGVIELIVLGLVNVVTIAAITEALARNGNVRYGNAYFGRLVTDYLGKIGYVILTPTLVLVSFVALLSYYVGTSTTLSDATGTPAALWAALLFLVVLYFLRRESLDATVASALIVGAINIGLLFILCLISLPYIRVENLMRIDVPLISGQPFDPSILALIFGVILVSYFGHTSAGNCAKLVLRRDPSGRALIWGSVAAIAVCFIMVGATVVIARQGAFTPRLVVELRADRQANGKSGFNVTANGTATPADVQLKYADSEQHLVGSSGAIESIAGLCSATFLLTDARADELKVWTHEITPEGNSQALPARLEVQANGPVQTFRLEQTESQGILPIDGAACRVKITFGDSSSS